MSSEARLAQQLDYGNRYLADLNYQEAAIAFQGAIEIEERNADAWLGYAQANAGLASTQTGSESEASYEQAEKAYLKVLELVPEQSQAYLELADLYIAMGVPEKAIRLLETAPHNVDSPESIQKRLQELREQYPGEVQFNVVSATTPATTLSAVQVQFSADGNDYLCSCDENGAITQKLPAGTYRMEIQYEGEALYQETVTVTSNEVKKMGEIPVELPQTTDPEAAQSALRDIMNQGLGDVPIVDFCVSDYDRDGQYEAFALVGENSEYGEFYGSLYFVTSDGVDTVLADCTLWPYEQENHLLHFEECDFYLTGYYFATGDNTYIFGVRDGDWYEHDFSCHGMSLHQDTETGTLTIIQQVYDGAYDFDFGSVSGHTYKPYYLYWDGDFKEYGGIEITEQDLLSLDGAQEIIDMILAEGYQIDSIFYRANGIINVNCSKTDEYFITYENMTLRTENEAVQAEMIYPDFDGLGAYSYGGIYSAAFAPERATYPDGFLR